MALITQADVENRIGRPLTAEEAAAFPAINAANQAYVERLIGSAVESVSPTTRYYDGGVVNVTIDPCTDISSVFYVDEDESNIGTLDTDEYITEPRNRTCKTWLRSRLGEFWDGMNNVAVTAKFSINGDANILAVVKDAILSSLEAEIGNTQNIKRESIEGYSVEFASSQTKDALDRLKFIFPGV